MEPYLCSQGYVTIGVGTKLHNHKRMNPKDFPIRVGRGMAWDWAESELELKYAKIRKHPLGAILIAIDPDRRTILLSMAFQLGVNGLFNFKRMWRYIASGNWDRAAIEMLDSKWARQTPERATRHARVMRGDAIINVYPNR